MAGSEFEADDEATFRAVLVEVEEAAVQAELSTAITTGNGRREMVATAFFRALVNPDARWL